MRALVVYESLHGNTAQVARAVGEGLSRHGDVTVADVRGARPDYAERFDLLVAGAPARAFSLAQGMPPPWPSRPHAGGHRPEIGLREWLRMLPEGAPHQWTVTFDVRVLDTHQLPGPTARRAAHLLHHLGYLALDEPVSFYVKRPGGPLLAAERARAAVWGTGLGVLMLTSH